MSGDVRRAIEAVWRIESPRLIAALTRAVQALNGAGAGVRLVHVGPGVPAEIELYFLDRDPRESWASLFEPFGPAQRAAGMGEVAFAAPFIPTIPGTDRYVDEV